MTANKTLKPLDPISQETGTELLAAGHTTGKIIGTIKPKIISISGSDLTEFGPSAEPDYSGLTTMGRFMADEGIGRMEKLICSSMPVRPPVMEERVEVSNSNRMKTSSVVVEVGSVCSSGVNRTTRDFGEG